MQDEKIFKHFEHKSKQVYRRHAGLLGSGARSAS
jgi:hypothetical protein